MLTDIPSYQMETEIGEEGGHWELIGEMRQENLWGEKWNGQMQDSNGWKWASYSGQRQWLVMIVQTTDVLHYLSY